MGKVYELKEHIDIANSMSYPEVRVDGITVERLWAGVLIQAGIAEAIRFWIEYAEEKWESFEIVENGNIISLA